MSGTGVKLCRRLQMYGVPFCEPWRAMAEMASSPALSSSGGEGEDRSWSQ